MTEEEKNSNDNINPSPHIDPERQKRNDEEVQEKEGNLAKILGEDSVRKDLYKPITEKTPVNKLNYEKLEILDPREHPDDAHFINDQMFDAYIKKIKPNLDISTVDAELEKYGNRLKKDEHDKDWTRCTYIALERALKFGPSDYYLAQAYADFNMQHKAAQMSVNADNPGMAVRFIISDNELIKDPKMIDKVLKIAYKGISKLEDNPEALQKFNDPKQDIASLKEDWNIYKEEFLKKFKDYE